MSMLDVYEATWITQVMKVVAALPALIHMHFLVSIRLLTMVILI